VAEPRIEILSAFREGSLRHLVVACERRAFKELEDKTSQLNRLVWLTFLLFCFRFQPRYFGFAFFFV